MISLKCLGLLLAFPISEHDNDGSEDRVGVEWPVLCCPLVIKTALGQRLGGFYCFSQGECW